MEKRTQAGEVASEDMEFYDTNPNLDRPGHFEKTNPTADDARRWEQTGARFGRRCVLDANQIFGFERSKPEDSGLGGSGRDPFYREDA